MLVRLRFTEEYPSDFSDEEKLALSGLVNRLANNRYREYEFDSRRLNLFKFYTLLVDLGFKNVKLEIERGSGLYYMILYKEVEFYDEIVIEFWVI